MTLLEEARRLRLHRRFSQNFLINEAVLNAITDQLVLEPDDTVVEIGAGGGFLTEKLLEHTEHVTAVELDRRMSLYLNQKFPIGQYPNFQCIGDDILRFDFSRIAAPRFKIVGNLPYAITSKILFLLVGELNQPVYPLRERIRQITIMVQKEVAERIAAIPGQKAYNPLSIAAQLHFEPKLAFIVPSRDFYPAPQVQSAVITLTPRQQPLITIEDPILFSRLIRTSFAQKRKTIRNALIKGCFAATAQIDSAFEKVGLDGNLRAEAVSPQTFGALAHVFSSNASQN